MGRSTPNPIAIIMLPMENRASVWYALFSDTPKKSVNITSEIQRIIHIFLEGNIGHAYAIEEFSSKQWIQQILKGC